MPVGAAAGEGAPFPSKMRTSLSRAFVVRAVPALVTLILSFEARPAEAADAPPPEARAVLARVQKAYTSSPSFTADFVETYAPSGFDAARPEAGRVTLQAPDRVRFDYEGPEGKVFTFDGKSARQYVAADRQMIVKTLPAADRERLPLLFFESAESVLTRYGATAEAGAGGLVEVMLTPKSGGEPGRLVLSVRPDGDVERLVVTDTSGNRTTFVFSRKAAGPRRPESEFALKPPAGTKVISE